MIRYVIFDTETTGLDPLNGDRVIEIGCVEMLDKQVTGRTYHQLINPECKLSDDTIDITHITDDMLADKPVFKDIVNDFLAFLNDTAGTDKVILVAHHASFDLKFLNHELKNIGLDGLQKFEVIDTQMQDGGFVVKVRVSVSKKKIAPKFAKVFPDVFTIE